MDAITSPPAPINEPNRNYAPGSPERASVEAELAHLAMGRATLHVKVFARPADPATPDALSILLR